MASVRTRNTARNVAYLFHKGLFNVFNLNTSMNKTESEYNINTVSRDLFKISNQFR